VPHRGGVAALGDKHAIVRDQNPARNALSGKKSHGSDQKDECGGRFLIMRDPGIVKTLRVLGDEVAL